MTLRQVSPAPFADLLAMLENAPPKLNVHRVALRQAHGGRSWGYLDRDGLCVACAGLFHVPEQNFQFPGPHSPDRYEAWFACHPAAGRHMRSFIRLAHLTLAGALQDGPVEITATLTTPAGRRIAALLGFTLGDRLAWVRSSTL